MTIYDGYFNKNFINNRMSSRISNIIYNTKSYFIDKHNKKEWEK